MHALPPGRTRLRDLAALIAPDQALKTSLSRQGQKQILRSAKGQATPKGTSGTDHPAPSPGRRPRCADLRTRASLAALGREWLQQLRVNAEGALSSSTPEYVHQLRVGLRRLRCLYGVLMDSDAAPPDIGRRALLDELRWIAGVLGEVRDLDVFATEMLPVASAALSKPEVLELQRRTARMRAARRKALRAALSSARFIQLPALIEAVLAKPLPELSGRSEGNVTALIVEAMQRRSRRARRWARRPEQEAPEKLHQLRIEIKKLRYLGNMIAPCHRGQAAQKYLRSITELQSTLGQLQDITTARQLIRQLVRGPGDTLSTNLHLMDAALAERQALVLVAITPAARRFRKLQPFWRGGA